MKSFLTALQFLTRIHLTEQRVWTDEDFGGAVVYFPLVGLLIGVILACINGAFGLFFSPLFTAVLTVAVWFFITGGLHADGYMDTADGLFSGRGRERMLEIMKDSRVGANGVIAFFFLAALKIVSLAELLQPWPLLIVVPAAARFAALVSIFKFPYARSEGLGRAYAAHGPSRVLVKGCVAALVPSVLVGILYVPVLVGAVVITVLADSYITARLGGVTGDTYGAVIEFTEMLLLVGAVFAAKLMTVYINGG